MTELQSDFAEQFRALTGYVPFPWQAELFARFVRGTVDRSLDIPTGLGKTAVMAIWLLARAHGAGLPRRLVYVVDRRAVVDQATEVAKELRKAVDLNSELQRALGLGHRSLPISTLRGQYVDNREWLEDPSAPAIIVGTIDMIGSRLLFEGYGTSRKMRPYHAGLLGADVLTVLDEAHLVPPFEKLLEAVADGGTAFGPRAEADRELIPAFRLLSLSATGRAHSGRSFILQDADLAHPVVKRRLDAPKRLTVHEAGEQALQDALAAHAWKLTDNGQRPHRIIVFCDKRELARKAMDAVKKLAKGDKTHAVPEILVDTELFVGGRRIFERQAAAKHLEELGFIAGSQQERSRATFLFATSAAEVGVDLDADHMVCDLVPWERMVQRLGRVNRRGEGDAQVVVVVEPPTKELEKAKAKAPEERNAKDTAAIADADRADAVRQLLDRLPRKGGAVDASPGALRMLKLVAARDTDVSRLLEEATTPAPSRPALSRALIDAWSMTSLEMHTGRPTIRPWLRGWVGDDPQTAVVWRTHLPVAAGRSPAGKDVQDYFEAAEPQTAEMLEADTYQVLDWLSARVQKLKRQSRAEPAPGGSEPERTKDVVALVLTSSGDLLRSFSLDELDFDSDADAKRRKEKKARVLDALKETTLILHACVCGLTNDGLLNNDSDQPPPTADGHEPWPAVPFKVRRIAAAEHQLEAEEGKTKDGWKVCFCLPVARAEDGEATASLIVENATSESRRAIGQPQTIDEHQAWAERRARALAARLSLPEPYVEMLAVTASLHDEGKRSKRWQRAFNAQKDQEYAKTRGPVNFAVLDGYRHEFGSLPVLAQAARFRTLPEDLQDLSLHLIAAHHGFARPIIRTDGCDEPPSALDDRARDVALRFARLQRRWGPWGLAWWEALVRAADQQASRDNDEAERTTVKETA